MNPSYLSHLYSRFVFSLQGVWRANRLVVVVCAAMFFSFAPAHAASPPAVDDRAPDFTLKTLEGKSVSLADVAKTGPVVLIVLRGWPGYQFPLCTRQVNEFTARATDFAAKGRF